MPTPRHILAALTTLAAVATCYAPVGPPPPTIKHVYSVGKYTSDVTQTYRILTGPGMMMFSAIEGDPQAGGDGITEELARQLNARLVELLDIAYTEGYRAGRENRDWNEDEAVNSQDFYDWLNHWFGE